MARWIIQVIKESINQQESQQTGSHVRAHDLRSQLASWALYKGASIQEVMDAAGWSSHTTFQSVYLKDPLCVQATTSARVLAAAAGSSSEASGSSRRRLVDKETPRDRAKSSL